MGIGHPRHTEDKRNTGRFFKEVLLLKLVMMSQEIAVVAGKDDDGIFPQSQFVEGIEHAADLGIHIGNAGVVGFQQSFVKFGSDALVID